MSFDNKLFGCFSDCCSCVTVAFIPCGMACVQGSAVAMATKTSCGTPCCLQLYLCCIGGAINRGKIREAINIDGSCFGDLCLHFWCGPCGVCQEYRETRDKAFAAATEAISAQAKFLSG